MIDPKKIDFNQIPKKFADGAIGSHGQNIFFFAFTSGNDLTPFACIPQTMKSIAEFMKKQVENYERQFGKIDMTPPKIVSPIQVSDLGKEGEGK